MSTLILFNVIKINRSEFSNVSMYSDGLNITTLFTIGKGFQKS